MRDVIETVVLGGSKIASMGQDRLATKQLIAQISECIDALTVQRRKDDLAR
jgi:hypothetical protein